MIHNIRTKAVLDTNVIYPIIIRDILFWFAHYDLFTPKWTKHIFEEWSNVMLRKGLTVEQAQNRITRAHLAFPDALVEHYEVLIETLLLPDPDDCHVLASAIKAKAQVIVTNNKKDFPSDYLERFGIKVLSADEFLENIIELNPDVCLVAFLEMLKYKKKTPLQAKDILHQLEKVHLSNTVKRLEMLLETHSSG